MSDFAIRASHLGKRYTLGESQSVFGRLRRKRPVQASSFWALDDVSFDITQGEAVGIIGHNGAGKSTLLKVLSRITEPTRGMATVEGRVASLLEVGTGFHPDLTGRENIFMNGSILGMRRAEIARNFDEIVAFADVERFVDTPVKRYSSGMYVRLAFSVAAHLEPEILIVDEVLAVGDVQFQKKCLGKMDAVSKSGRTVLFVSHNMAAVRQLTTRCILLKKGNVFFDGTSERAVEHYSAVVASAFEQGGDLKAWPRPMADRSAPLRFRSLSFRDGQNVFAPGGTITIEGVLEVKEPVPAVRISGTIFQGEGAPVGSFFSAEACSVVKAGEICFHLPLEETRLAPGSYSFGLSLVRGTETTGHRDYDTVLNVLPFEVGAISGEEATVGAWPRNWGSIKFGSPLLELEDHG